MPRGNPSAQTIASEKYQKKVGYVSKSYKLRKEVVEKFDHACECAGVSKSAQLSKMMLEFAKKIENDDKYLKKAIW